MWGNNGCEHEWGADILRVDRGAAKGKTALVGNQLREISGVETKQGQFCLLCNAWRGELGLEPTIELYIQHLMVIFAEVKRVLKKTGTCWVVIDDSYAGSWGAMSHNLESKGKRTGYTSRPNTSYPQSAPQKSLCLIPQRFAIAMVEDDWLLRNDVVWYKSNPMPESVKDRFTGSWEHLFFFVKSKERSNDIKRWLPEQLPNDNRAWLAAMVDAEGTIGIRKSVVDRPHDTFGAYITISNASKAIIERCVSITGIGGIKSSGNKTNLDIYRWEVTHNDALSIIGEIYPYLIAKREQAKVCIALQKTNYHRGSPKGSRDGPIPLTEKEYQEKIRLWELCKSLNEHEVTSANLPEPNLNRYSGCEDYWFEQQFEPVLTNERERLRPNGRPTYAKFGFDTGCGVNPTGRNKRDVWEISTQPYPEAHFATFPEKLCETPIMAGCPSMICKKCGKAREKIYKKGFTDHNGDTQTNFPKGTTANRLALLRQAAREKGTEYANDAEILGYTDCGCNVGFELGVCLDPFCGSGTVLAVAKKLGRKGIGIELNPQYCDLTVKRLQEIPLNMGI